MKWLIALVLLAAGAVGINAWASGPDLTCPGAGTTAFRDGSSGLPTPDDALDGLLDEVARVTHERNEAAGLETVTYRGYDSGGELLSVVVVEGADRGWIASRVDTCE